MAAAVIGGTLAVLGIAVLAGRGGGLDEGHGVPQMGVPGLWVDAILVVLVTLGIAVAIAAIVAQVRSRDHQRRELVAQRFVIGAVFIVVVAVMAYQLFGEADPDRFEIVMDPPPMVVDETEDESTPGEDPAGWPLLVALALGAVAVGAVPLAARLLAGRRDDEAEDESARLAEQRRDLLIGLLDDAIDDLRHHPDPREAVIAAWTRFEDALTLAGLEPEPSDTPMRYLARVLRTVDASGPAITRLTNVFEVAVYSTHPVDRAAQIDAVDAVVAVRDELRVSADRSRQRSAS